MAGTIVNGTVVVEQQSEASKIYNKGYFGTMHRGRLYLHVIEAAFLVEVGRLEVIYDGLPVSLASLMEYGLQVNHNFEIMYLVFRELRQRGYAVKIGDDGLDPCEAFIGAFAIFDC